MRTATDHGAGTVGASPAPDGRALPRLARDAVVASLAGRPDAPPRFQAGTLSIASPVFVTIRRRSGELRGCVGTLAARCRDVAAETWRVAREAAFGDTRFAPVGNSEIDELRFEVSVVHPLEEVSDPSALDPRRYGIVVSTGDGRRGALLPAIEGIDTTSQQLALARRKGGIGATETVRIQRFEVDRFSELESQYGRRRVTEMSPGRHEIAPEP